MKRNDRILILTLLVIGGICVCLFPLFRSDGELVVVRISDEVYGTYQLQEDQVVEIGTHNTLEIKKGRASMINASCPDLICVHHQPVSKDGDTIVCLPNKTIIEIESRAKASYDAVAQ